MLVPHPATVVQSLESERNKYGLVDLLFIFFFQSADSLALPIFLKSDSHRMLECDISRICYFSICSIHRHYINVSLHLY